MSSAQDWYARKLGGQQPQQRQQQQYQTPYQHPRHQPGYVEPGQPPASWTQPPQEDEGLTLHNFVHKMGQWRGGQAHRTDKQPCPECGSDLFFSRGNANSRNGAPAPHCFSCGYSGGLIPTQGDAAVWQGA